MRIFRRRRGFVLILSLGLTLPLFACLGLLIDLGLLWQIEADAVQAARASALLAANRMPNSYVTQTETPATAAQQMGTAYGTAIGHPSLQSVVSVNAGNTIATVTTTVPMQPIIMGLFGFKPYTMTVHSSVLRTLTNTPSSTVAPIYTYTVTQ